jgi:hypothetical protein
VTGKGVENLKDLHGELPDRYQDDSAKAIHGHELISIEFLYERDEVGEGLA